MSQETTIEGRLARAAARGAETSLDLEGRQVLERVAARLTGRLEAVCVGRYRLERTLGHGGCGVVHLAVDPELQREVAIKVVHPSGEGATDAEARLVREAQALAKLRHPNIVEVFDVGIDETAGARGKRGVYIVMERVEGVTLEDWLEAGPREPAEIFEMFAQAARGLGAAHEAGVIHRDFKPSNVMVAGERVKVLDFGLAREDTRMSSAKRSSAEEPELEPDVGLTRTGTVMGTPRYMPPEQHDGLDVDATADQYAWCVALWASLTGEPPFTARGLGELLAQKRRGPPPLPAGGRMTTSVHRVLARGLQPDPARRFADMGELSRSLAAARRRGGRAWVALAGIGLALVATAVVATRDPELPVACATAIPSTWAPEEIERISATLATTPADPRWGLHVRVEARLHRFVDRFTSARAALCDPESTPMPSAERDERVACLERGRARLDGILAAYADGGEGVASAHRRLWSSETPAACANEAPSTIFARSEEEEAELDALDAEIVAFGTSDLAQMDDEGLARLSHALERADALHDPALAVQALFVRGMVEQKRAEFTKAAATVQEAVWRAEANDDALLAAEYMPSAVRSLQSAGAANEELDRLLVRAEAILEKAGAPLHASLWLDRLRMLITGERGDMKGALEIGRQALERGLAERIPGTERALYDMLLLSGQVHWHSGLFAVARGDVRRALEIAPRDAPWFLAGTSYAHATLAAIAYTEGDEDEAIREILVAIDSSTASPNDPEVQGYLAFYGFFLFELGQLEEGRAHLRRARDVIALEHGFSSPGMATIAGNLALVELARRDFTAALEMSDLQLELETERQSRKEQAVALVRRAHALLRLGRVDEAERDIDRARELGMPQGDGNIVRAEIDLERGRWDDAQKHGLIALENFDPSYAGRRADGGRGRAYLVLARAAHGRGETDDARELGRIATTYFRRSTASDQWVELPDIERWLATLDRERK
jgi:tetratricopeptide (TPR) repeat protein